MASCEAGHVARVIFRIFMNVKDNKVGGGNYSIRDSLEYEVHSRFRLTHTMLGSYDVLLGEFWEKTLEQDAVNPKLRL